MNEGFFSSIFLIILGVGFFLEVYYIHHDYYHPIPATVERHLWVNNHWEQTGESFIVANYLDFIQGKTLSLNDYRQIQFTDKIYEIFYLEFDVRNPRNMWRLAHTRGIFYAIFNPIFNVVINGCLLLSFFVISIQWFIFRIVRKICEFFIAYL